MPFDGFMLFIYSRKMLNQLSDIENCFVPTIKGHFQLAMANTTIFQINSRCSNGPIGNNTWLRMGLDNRKRAKATHNHTHTR